MVSVIIPNYNHASFLEQRIETVLEQTYQDIELIILDDVSTDESRSIIEQYRSHPKVSIVVYNETNSGSTFKQWDKGIQLAKGEWIWIAESDDWCENNLLETLIDGVDNTCTLAVAQSVVVTTAGEIMWLTYSDFFTKIHEGRSFIKDKMLLDNFGIPNASMCIFKREAYYSIDKQFTTYRFCGDWLFWINVALQGNVFVSGKYLNYFRKHSKDVSGSAYKNGLHYTEHFRLLENAKALNVLNEKEKKSVLRDRYRMFLHDKRMDEEPRRNIQTKFRKSLGTSYFKVKARQSVVSFLKQFK